MKRFIIALLIGVVCLLYSHLLPYYPIWWSISFALIVLLVAYHSPRVAAFLTMVSFAMALAYHSFALVIIYAFAAFIFLSITVKLDDFSEIYLLMAICPFLSKIVIGDYYLPIEFIIVILTPILIKGNKIPLVAGLACFWTCLLGVIGQQEFMGNLVVGGPRYIFYTLRPVPVLFYDFSWVGTKLGYFMVKGWEILPLTILNLIRVVFAYPLIIIQSLAWATISYTMGICVERRKLQFDFLAIFLGICLLIFLQAIAAIMSPEKSPVSFSSFLALLLSVSLLLFVLWKSFESSSEKLESFFTNVVKEKLKKHDRDLKPSRIIQNVLNQQEDEKTKQPEKESEHIEVSLTSYIKRQFVYDATVVFVDVVESTKLKKGETQHDIIAAFSDYWRVVDDAFWDKQGRLLNRSGDGAAYVFKYADYAVVACKDLFKRLDRFNKKKNVLKMPFRVRVGLNTGKIIEDASRSSGDVFSSVIDIAAHLQKMAEPGGIIISSNTYEKLTKTKASFKFMGFSEKDQVEIYTLR